MTTQRRFNCIRTTATLCIAVLGAGCLLLLGDGAASLWGPAQFEVR